MLKKLQKKRLNLVSMQKVKAIPLALGTAEREKYTVIYFCGVCGLQ